MVIFGHRGAPGYPRRAENTRGSFRKALESGASGIEFDVRRCRDGRLVVIHDETIDRTTNGRGRVRELSYEELQRFDAGSGEPIPLLTAILEEFGPECLVNVELKDAGIAPDVKQLVVERRLAHRVIVSSFDANELLPLMPQVPVALLSSKAKGLVTRARGVGAAAIHPRCNVVTQDLIHAAHDANLRVHVWTVNEAREFVRLAGLGVDAIFTDVPERFVKWERGV
jgi:glycerophosphoryl diester phosphodiesterase